MTSTRIQGQGHEGLRNSSVIGFTAGFTCSYTDSTVDIDGNSVRDCGITSVNILYVLRRFACSCGTRQDRRDSAA